MIFSSSSVFSRSARMLEEMPSSDFVSSWRKCRRLPNIMSRMMSRLHLSPSTSSERLIGQPERLMSVMFGSRRAGRGAPKTACNIAPVISGYNQLQNAISSRECCDGQVDHVESDDAGWFRRRSEPGYLLAFGRRGRGTGAIVDRAVERRRRIAVRPGHLRADGKSLAERDRRNRRFHECRAEILLL